MVTINYRAAIETEARRIAAEGARRLQVAVASRPLFGLGCGFIFLLMVVALVSMLFMQVPFKSKWTGGVRLLSQMLGVSDPSDNATTTTHP